jgi:WD40 repeat protein
MTITPQERRLYKIALVSIFVSLVLFIFSIVSHKQRNFAVQQAATAQAERSFATEQMATAQINVEEAKNQVTISRANELAAQSSAERNINLQRAMLLGIEAYRIDENVRTKSALFDNARADSSTQFFLSGAQSFAEFTPDGNVLATGTDNGIILWDVKTGQIIRKMEWQGKDDFITRLAFSHDGTVLSSTSYNKRVAFWNVSTGKLLEKQPPVEERYVYLGGISFSPTADIAAISSCAYMPNMLPCESDQTILWNVKTGQTIEELEIGSSFISFSPDGNLLAFGENNSAILWNIEDHRVDKILPAKYPEGHPVGTKPLMFFMDGTLLAGDKIWDVNTGQPISQSLQATYINVFSPDGGTMFIPNKGQIITTNMKTGEGRLFAQFPDQSDLRILAVNPDGNLLAVIRNYSSRQIILVKKYELFQPLGRMLAAIADPYKFTDRLVFSPDGQTLTAASPPAWGVAMQWDVQSGQLLKDTSPNSDFLPNSKREAYSLDGNIKASIDFDNDTIVIWDAKLKKKIRTLDLEGDQLWQRLALSPDGKMLAAKDFLELVLWDVESGQNIGEPLKLTGEEMIFSPDGKLLATTGLGYIGLWDMDPQSWLEQTCKRVGRNLTALEWEKYFPGEEYRITCPQWPPAY